AGCAVVVLTDPEGASDALEAIEAGAVGIVSKDDPVEDLADAVVAVHRGDAVVPPRMLREIFRRAAATRRDREETLRVVASLTPREREVLALIVDDRDTASIARDLGVSTATARSHVHNLLAKLGVHSRKDAAGFARQRGLVRFEAPDTRPLGEG